MTISVNWPTGVIFVPKSDLVFVSGSIYELDVNDLRLALKDLEDDEAGAVWASTHNHNSTVTLSGVTYARTIEIINGYTVEFEDGQYTVSCVGANHNLADVKVQNQVSLIIGNSSGLVQGGSSSGGPSAPQIADAVWNSIIECGHTAEDLMRLMVCVMSAKITGAGTGVVTVKSLDGVKDRIIANTDSKGNRTSVTLDSSP